MSGVGVIRVLLAANEPLTAVIPSARIKAGVLPLYTIIPAISISQISKTSLSKIRPNEPKFYVSRVQVTVYRKEEPDDRGYPGLDAALKLVLAACPSQRATIAGVKVDSIIPDTEGPDLYYQESQTYTRSQDFIVRYAI